MAQRRELFLAVSNPRHYDMTDNHRDTGRFQSSRKLQHRSLLLSGQFPVAVWSTVFHIKKHQIRHAKQCFKLIFFRLPVYNPGCIEACMNTCFLYCHKFSLVWLPGVRIMTVFTAHRTPLEKNDKTNSGTVYGPETLCRMNIALITFHHGMFWK